MNDHPPFEDILIYHYHFALLCEVIDIPSTVSQDDVVGTVSVLLDSNIIVHDVVDNSHLFLTPDTHRMRRAVDPDELEPSLYRVVHSHRTENEVSGVVHPHSNVAILPTGLLDIFNLVMYSYFVSLMYFGCFRTCYLLTFSIFYFGNFCSLSQ